MLKLLKNLKFLPSPSLNKAGWLLGTLAVSTLLTPVGYSNVVGTDMQNFNPTTSGLDFVTVESSETLNPGNFNFGLFLNYAVNSLPYFDEEDGEQDHISFNDSLLSADLNLGLGLLPNWDIGISLPQVLDQKVESDEYHGQFGTNGNTEVRVNTKFRMWGTDSYGIAIIGSANINRVENNPYAGEDAGPIYNLQLAADTTIANVALGANVGYRWREPGEKTDDTIPVTPLENQYIASVAASILFPYDTKLIFELFGSRPAEDVKEQSDRLPSSGEALIGIKHDISNTLAMHFGGGTEVNHGLSSPDYRLYAGLNWSTGKASSRPRKVIQEKPRRYANSDPFAGTPQLQEKIVIHDILFEFDSDNLVVGETRATLTKLAKYLIKAPVYKKLIIEGHTDSVGPDAYNNSLSLRRAKTIKRWLVSKNKLDANKIVVIGKGERSPIADNGNFQGRQLNRRVEFVIYRK